MSVSQQPPQRHWSLARAFPELSAEWHPEKNRLSPDHVVWGSGRRVWWKCPAGPDHEWQTKVQHRTQAGSGCPCCVNKKVSVTNSLRTVAPELAAQVHPEYPRTASEIIATSHEKVLWRCPAGPDHVWRANVKDRVRRRSGCPFCSHKRLSVTNSLQALHPALAREFATDLNGVTPAEVIAGANKRFYWRCPVAPDHVWKTTANNRVSNETGCPHCCGQRPSTTNSLARHPQLAAEFHPTKNLPLRPRDIPSGTTRQVWWRCQINPRHEWRASVVNRTRGRGCPGCSPARHSKKEIALAAELSAFFPCDLEDHKVIAGRRTFDVDIVLRADKLVVEYDGHHWHRSRLSQDRKKTRALERAGWRVVRVRERELEKIGRNDLLVSRNDTVKELADALIPHLARVTGRSLPKLERYLGRDNCVNSAKAAEIIAKLQK